MSNPLQNVTSGYTQTCKDGVIVPATGKQISLVSARIVNQSGSALDAAIAKKQAVTDWKFYTLTAASDPDATDFTDAIQAGGAVNIFTTTNNDGFMVGSKEKFNLIGLNISQAETGSPVYAYKYWNGSSYASLTVLSSPAAYSAGTQLIVFAAPADWVTGTDVTTGGDPTYYYIKAVATTHGSQIVQANAAWVCQFISFQPSLADKTALEFKVTDSSLPLTLSGTEAVLPYFATANAKNLMSATYTTS